MSGFSSFHPVTSLVYFLSVLVLTMFFASPVIYVIAFVCGIVCLVKLQNRFIGLKEGVFYLITFLLVSLTNPLFSHNGVTTLFFINSNPVTLEAVLYGVSLGFMLLSVILWFRCFNLVVTEDKLLFLFGRFSPKLALLISCVLRFLPPLKRQGEKIRQSQKTMGAFSTDSYADRIKATAKVYSALVTWGLEKAVDTGASMKARGYGLKGRTAFSLYKFRNRDLIFIAFVILADAAVLGAMLSGALEFSFYPYIEFSSVSVWGVCGVSAFFALCILPFIIEVKEGLMWKFYRSKI